MPQFRIDKEIFEKFPGLVVGVVMAHRVTNAAIESDLQAALAEEVARIRREFQKETLPEHPRIKAWREAYVAFGAKPKEHRSSIENLYRLVLNGVDPRHMNTLVDLYNLVSLKHMLPVGGEDTDRIVGDLVLTFAGPNEPPVALLGDSAPRPPHQGEVIYKDDVSAICRRFNWREADRTKLTEQTTNAVLVVEGLPPATRADVEAAISDLEALVKKYCHATTRSTVLDRTATQTDLL